MPLLLSWKAQAERAAAQKIGHSVESTFTTALNSAPPLPSYYVERQETLARLIEMMVNHVGLSASLQNVCAIHGMGGIGKSTIAAAFCHDPAVRNYFQEGVLWATLGLNPDILPILVDWIQLLGDYEFKPSTVGTAAARFRSLASDRQILVVLDDAWNPGDVSPFAVGGRVRTLLTTRELDVARYLDSVVIEVDPFTPQQCLDMFGLAVGKPLLAETIPQAERLASMLGRLPLALELAVAQIKDGVSWANLSRELEGEIVKLDALSRPDADEEKDEFARKRLSLRACFHLSLKRLKTHEITRFAWLGVLRDDAPFTPAVAATAWECDDSSAAELLNKFRVKALLRLLEGSASPYIIHDLLHDEALTLLTEPKGDGSDSVLAGLGMTLETAHYEFLARYRRRMGSASWADVPEDGYIHAHLAWHLEKTGTPSALHALLDEQTKNGSYAWYGVRHRLGQVNGFLADLNRAWRLADQSQPDRPSESLGLQCRYALIAASLNSVASLLTSSLLVAAVKADLWTPAQATGYARRIPEPKLRLEALSSLLPLLSPESCADIVAEALAVANSIGHTAYLVLLDHVPGPHRQAVLQAALRSLRAVTKISERLEGLCGVGKYMEEADRLDLVREVMEALAQPRNSDARAPVLNALAFIAGPDQRSDILRRAVKVRWPLFSQMAHVQALCGLAAIAEPAEKELAFQKALTVARQSKGRKSLRAEALSYLAGQFKDSPHALAVVNEAFEAAAMLKRKEDRAEALSHLAPIFRLGQFEARKNDVVLLATSVRNAERFVPIAVRLLPHLAPSDVRKLLPSTATMARRLENPRSVCDALSFLSEFTEPDERKQLLQEALQLAQKIDDRAECDRSQCDLTPFLPDEDRRAAMLKALEYAGSVRNKFGYWDYERILVLVAPLHQPDLWDRLVEDAGHLSDRDARQRALTAILSNAPESRLNDVFTRFEQFKNVREGRVLANLTSRYPEAGIPERLARFRGTSLRTLEEFLSDSAERGVPHGLESVAHQALQLVKALPDDKLYTGLLACIARYLPEADIEAMLETAVRLPNRESCGPVLSALARRFPPGKPVALWHYDGYRALLDRYGSRYLHPDDEVRDLAQALAPQPLRRFYEKLRIDSPSRGSARPISLIVPHLPKADRAAAAGAALKDLAAVYDKTDQLSIMSTLAGFIDPQAAAPHWSALFERIRVKQYETDIEFYEDIGGKYKTRHVQKLRDEHKRLRLLCDFARLAPAAMKDQAVREAIDSAREADALGDLAGVLPFLDGNERNELCGQMLAVIEGPYNHTNLIAACPARRDEILAHALGPNGKLRKPSELLPRILEVCPESERGTVFQVIAAASAESDDLVSLVQHATLLPAPELRTTFAMILHAFSTRRRAEAVRTLCSLGPLMTAVGGAQAAGAGYASIDNVVSRWP